MPSDFTIIPKVRIRNIPILNVKTKEIEILDINELYPFEAELEFETNNQQSVAQTIREIVESEIMDTLRDGRTGNGLNEILGLDESPPRFIYLEDDEIEDWVLSRIGTDITARYYLTKIDTGMSITDYRKDRPLKELIMTKIFLSAPPKIRYNKCEFFTPDKHKLLYTEWKGQDIEASCGFQFFHQEFGSKSNYSKYFGKTKCDDVVHKIKDWANKDPPQYQDWLSVFKGNKFVENLNLSKIKPVPDWLDLDSLCRDLPEVSIVDFKRPVWTDEEEYNSLNLLEIVKLCMWARLNLVMTDDLDQVYLTYMDDHFTHPKGKRKKKGAVCVKVVDNHGYFVIDKDIKLSATMRSIHWDGLAGTVAQQRKVEKSEVNDIVTDYTDINFIKHPQAKFKHGDLVYEWDRAGIDWENTNEEQKKQECMEYRNRKIMFACKNTPPPTPEQLLSLMSGKKPSIYFTGNTNLNGLVDWLLRIHKVKPDNCRGLAHAIHKATYGKLKIMAYHQHPKTLYKFDLNEHDGDLVDRQTTIGTIDPDDYEYLEQEKKHKQEELDCWEWWRDNYPELKATPIPSASCMANAIFDKDWKKKDILSTCNITMRDILYEAEIKPDFRVEKPSDTDSRYGFSLDFKKAYTNAMKLMDCEWSIFDAIDQPKKYKTFNENNFYLCEEPSTSYPYKGEGGLVLYHGCLLRHLLGEVKPVYEIAAHKRLKKDYFVPFVEKCIELGGDGKKNVVSSKSLINNFIGTLKRKDGISDYRLTINQDKIKSQRNLFQGHIVSNLNENSKFRWKGNTYLTANPYYKYHYQTGQPIRLQVIDRINECNLLMWRAYKQSLSPDLYPPHLVMVKTDALYFEYPCEGKDFQPKEIVGDINKLLPEGYEVNIERECIGLDRNSDFIGHKEGDEDGYRFDGISVGEPDQKQRRVRMSRNAWKNVWDITHKWRKSACLAIIKTILVNGGALIEGEAGTGKTEIIKELDEIKEKNRKRYRWAKLFYKLTQPQNYYQLCEDWRDRNPVFVEKFAPTNKACNNIGGKTLHKGLGLEFNLDEDNEGKEEEVKSVEFMERIVSRFAGDGRTKPRVDILVFDEISMMGGDSWSALAYIKLRCPTIKFILCGDIKRQLPPVKEESRDFYYARILKELTNSSKINLHYNFRRNGDANELWEDWSLNPDRFTEIQDQPLLTKNLSFTNKTRKQVIDLVQEREVASVELECKNEKDYNSNKGQQKILKIAWRQPLIARVSIKEWGVAKNEIWNVKYVRKTELLLEREGKEDIPVPFDKVLLCFLSGYCITIHKSQGDTYRDPYTIWDWDKISFKSLFDRRLRYVAQSRSVEPKKLITYRN